MLKMMRGALIVFEGCDRAGKTTQCTKLAEKIVADGGKVILQKFPERSSLTGQLVDDYLRNKLELNDRTVHLVFSANRWEKESQMKHLLMNGTNVIVDRYAYSGVAYSAAKEGLDIEWCRGPDVGLPRPDIVIFLDLDLKVAALRGGYGKERYEFSEFQEEVRRNFLKLKDEYWMVVDATQNEESIHEEIWRRVKEVMNDCSNNPIGRLWC